MKTSLGGRIFSIVNYGILLVCSIIALYPLVFTFSMSISDPIFVAQNKIFIFPKGFSLESYKIVFDDSQLLLYYYNTLWYTIVGTSLNVLITLVSAYPLSRKRYFLRNKIMIMITITMFFGGGLIPSFILVNQLGIYNTRWAIILPSAISTWNLILCRTFFQGIPDSLEEASTIDGATQFKIFSKIFLPLSMPIIAVLVLFYAVGHWNSYFSAMLYLPNVALQPMQVYLRKVLILANTSLTVGDKLPFGSERSMATLQLKYTVIIVATLPILAIYPFLQKYFVQGVMIGSIKG